MLDHLPAPVVVFAHASVLYVGAAVFGVVVTQPWWIPLLCSAMTLTPYIYRACLDTRLKVLNRTNHGLLAEVERQKRRAEVAEAKLESVNVDGINKLEESK